ncbi:valyl-tRNA synthetase [Chlorella sorokiniana]|uniref:valine--tRNA ligase n=1 Tax=Chlorella sorokiniana TaxID=3076 RepID=A0A2P6TFY5_CHLSO|nr:valyl-tRNA synthetase [Chlorella sorokiniana]|eukprot:PRW33017.1 valyl-tRNA synthetase [Chlorella sorokiniana]
MSQALLPSAARRQLLGSSTPRRLATGSQLGSALCARPVGLPALQRQQQQRRLAAAAASAAAAEATTAAAPTSAQRKELPKNFDPAASEEALYQWWESNGYFKPDPNAAGEPYVISMPPPNVTGKLHMGHAMFATLQDIMARYQRMRGRPTLWLPGTDHAGIATQMVVEKQLAAQGRDRREMGREAFEAEVWGWKAQYGGFITQQLRRLGASCDWSRERFTLDSGLSEAVLEAFVRLHEKGLVYRGSYMVNWSPGLQTAVSDLEVDYSEEPGTLYYFKYPVADSDEFLPVATTRPETILGDTAVAVHPEDERYKHLVGREAVVPQSGRRIKIIADEYVDREFGTGALKITPGHDVNDYEIGKRFDLEIINIMNDDGTLNAAAGPYAGLDRFAARKQLWADMEAQGLVIKSEPYQMRVPRSQRGGEIVEPLVREQWFVRMEPLAKPALEAVASGAIRILPERFEKVYNFWLENIKDWCISRQLWWGHRIPVWYVFDSAEAAAAASSSERYIVAKSEAEAQQKAEAQYGAGVVLKQESDVLDTWFSSGLWPFSTLGWPAATPDLERFYPTSVMETGHDILFFWVARMIMMGLEFTGRPPFSTVYLHGLVRDEKGRKMSKSLGNVVDPVETIGQYGADALRFTLATGTSPGQDLNLSLDRVNSSRNFTNKLWNAGKFVLFNLEKVDDAEWQRLASADFSTAAATASLALPERWVVSALHRTVADITAAHERFDFGEAGRLLYDFVWSDFADWYIEAAKARLYGGDEAAAAQTRQVLVYVYDRILRLAHPFMPFITEEMWQATPHTGAALIAAPWPAADAPVDEAAAAQFEALQAAVRAVRNARAEYGVEPGRKIAATVRVDAPELRAALQAESAVLALLAKLDAAQVSFVGEAEGAALSGQKGQIELVVGEGVEVFLPMAGLFDADKEIERLQKQEGKLEKELAGLQARLSNKKFVDKAPPAVVAEVQGQAADLGEQLATVREKMDKFRALA